MENSDLESRLKGDPIIQRLLNNSSWRPAAEAAINHFIYGEPCPVTSWKKSSSWQQVEMVYNKISKRDNQ